MSLQFLVYVVHFFRHPNFMFKSIKLSLKLYGKIIQPWIWAQKSVFWPSWNFFFKNQVKMWKIEIWNFFNKFCTKMPQNSCQTKFITIFSIWDHQQRYRPKNGIFWNFLAFFKRGQSNWGRRSENSFLHQILKVWLKSRRLRP